MRVIERDMIQAIKDKRDWKSSNTSVDITPMHAEVCLHGNLIAKYNYRKEELIVSSAGWETNTTKSRLNALVNEFLDGTQNGIFQKAHVWYITDNGRTRPFQPGFNSFDRAVAIDVEHCVMADAVAVL
tara:strand:+ start:104 stop:487 length:384 start_codon:yes stop_codon:yes gene_type:complete